MAQMTCTAPAGQPPPARLVAQPSQSSGQLGQGGGNGSGAGIGLSLLDQLWETRERRNAVARLPETSPVSAVPAASGRNPGQSPAWTLIHLTTDTSTLEGHCHPQRYLPPLACWEIHGGTPRPETGASGNFIWVKNCPIPPAFSFFSSF